VASEFPVLPAGQRLSLTVLGAGSAASMEADVSLHDGEHLLVRVPNALPASAAVRLEWDRRLLLGEVVASRAERDAWTSWLRVQQGLFSTRSLQRLAEIVNAWSE